MHFVFVSLSLSRFVYIRCLFMFMGVSVCGFVLYMFVFVFLFRDVNIQSYICMEINVCLCYECSFASRNSRVPLRLYAW